MIIYILDDREITVAEYSAAGLAHRVALAQEIMNGNAFRNRLEQYKKQAAELKMREEDAKRRWTLRPSLFPQGF